LPRAYIEALVGNFRQRLKECVLRGHKTNVDQTSLGISGSKENRFKRWLSLSLYLSAERNFIILSFALCSLCVHAIDFKVCNSLDRRDERVACFLSSRHQKEKEECWRRDAPNCFACVKTSLLPAAKYDPRAKA
jgi:hypothetical protein